MTRPGLPVPVGESAINPVPRRQIKEAVLEGLTETGIRAAVSVTVEVANGEEIAKKTLNPRLGIMGGISILGTRGTVKPFSNKAYRDTITMSLDVARAQGFNIIALTTGGRSERFLKEHQPDLPDVAFIQVADFFAFSIKEAVKKGFDRILYSCFFGKLVKMAQGHPYTHARTSRIDFDALASWGLSLGMGKEAADAVIKSNTAREALIYIREEACGKAIIRYIMKKALISARGFAGTDPDIIYYLFDFGGDLLSTGRKKGKGGEDMHQIYVLGLGIDHKEIAPGVLKRIAAAEVLVGGDRLLNIFRDHPGIKVPIRSPLKSVIEQIKNEMQLNRNVVVLADGDPLFFGIGERLINVLGRGAVTFEPNVTALQAAASRMKIPWHTIQTVSLHGRQDLQPLLAALVHGHRIGVYTDANFPPAGLAQELLERGIDAFDMHVFEDLGTASEKARCFTLKGALKKVFSPLNFIILERTKPSLIPLSLGLDDDLYLHQKGLITKKEIRAAGLAFLGIAPNHTIWDLGAGCGSVAIEASFLARRGAVLAVEKNADRVQLIRDNIRRMGAYGVHAVHGEMPECLEDLPDPDRIFMGGGMGKNNRVLETAAERLRPGGRLVLHLVLMGSLARTRDYLQSLNWPVALTQIQASRSGSIAGDLRLAALNPVFIVSAEKK